MAGFSLKAFVGNVSATKVGQYYVALSRLTCPTETKCCTNDFYKYCMFKGSSSLTGESQFVPTEAINPDRPQAGGA